jgi:hypothetical protein
MKRSLALFFLILICSRPVLAFGKGELGQFYDGEAKPRAEVAWIWIKGDLHISQIDHSRVAMYKSTEGVFWMVAVEVLPGKHFFNVYYWNNGSIWSKENQEVEIDAKAGENYFLSGDTKWKDPTHWFIKTGTFSPKPNEENLRRKLLERPVSVDGVVQNYNEKHSHLVLTVPGSVQAREFFCVYTVTIGQKIRVLYFPSMPDMVIKVDPI